MFFCNFLSFLRMLFMIYNKMMHLIFCCCCRSGLQPHDAAAADVGRHRRRLANHLPRGAWRPQGHRGYGRRRRHLGVLQGTASHSQWTVLGAGWPSFNTNTLPIPLKWVCSSTILLLSPVSYFWVFKDKRASEALCCKKEKETQINGRLGSVEMVDSFFSHSELDICYMSGQVFPGFPCVHLEMSLYQPWPWRAAI